MPDDPRKAAARGVASRAHNCGEARGKGQREGDEMGRHTVRDIGGGKREGRSRDVRQAGTTSEKVRRVRVVWVQLLARVYI